ncbi:monocarboxylate transporter 13-like isoform X2 [Mercenaria mercenaria]|nr:monocarboxylate transporter 13-like isoform X2 [Mercenaria mercenaria]XP_053376597.1 monocarboxylate transporter 13-like isoform X2 [Mercenaria mercenaria]XP_053376599.1 monocarboxylate transporter 13-like isoform X2 [Mercenaria mercenaria]XP_053376604.1 monocarboxylate transporter 13-like isoform X2 [Mercenaria mercenaria]XP_053376608.1 monocarboxylate transporter 13-like isoform X2 [Mercenaria mercenaria]XP_053376611.1 monocarboxylate transporter 13-like isoform X2 [Mercenaria mercenaria]
MKWDLSDRRVDGGYGPIIVLSSFCLIVITDGILFSFGNLMVELIEEFNNDRATTALVASILIGISGLIGPFCGGLCGMYGCRVIAVVGSILSCVGLLISTFATSIYFLYIFYGCIGGVGLGCIYLTGNIITVQHFSKRRGLACGITLCGSGVGTFAFNQFTRVLIAEYGWRGTILIEAGMCLQCVVFSLFLLAPFQEKTGRPNTCFKEETVSTIKPDNFPNAHNCEHIPFTQNTGEVKIGKSVDKNNFEMETEPEESAIKRDTGKREIYKSPDSVLLKQMFQSIFDTSLLADLRFWIFLLSTVVVHLAFSVVITMTADRAMELGMTKYEASWLASSIGIANTASRICFGWLADRRFMSRIVMASLLLLLAGVSTALSYLLKTFSTRIVGTSLYGFCIGGYIAMCPLVLADMFSPELIAKSLGLYLFALGLSTVASTPIGGLLFDKTGNYDVTFVVAGSELIIAGLLMLFGRRPSSHTEDPGSTTRRVTSIDIIHRKN